MFPWLVLYHRYTSSCFTCLNARVGCSSKIKLFFFNSKFNHHIPSRQLNLFQSLVVVLILVHYYNVFFLDSSLDIYLSFWHNIYIYIHLALPKKHQRPINCGTPWDGTLNNPPHMYTLCSGYLLVLWPNGISYFTNFDFFLKFSVTGPFLSYNFAVRKSVVWRRNHLPRYKYLDLPKRYNRYTSPGGLIGTPWKVLVPGSSK